MIRGLRDLARVVPASLKAGDACLALNAAKASALRLVRNPKRVFLRLFVIRNLRAYGRFVSTPGAIREGRARFKSVNSVP
jgi:hypothetical protein